MTDQRPFELHLVKGKAVHDVVHGDLAGCVEAVHDAYIAHGAGRSVNPPSSFLLFPERPNARIIALPAYLGDRFRVSGIKWIASYPDNVRRGVPRASAVLVLNDYETGYPIGILESSIISASRTAASAVVAAAALRRDRRARRLGIIGTGLIARYIHRFFAGTGWDIHEVALYDLVPAEAEKFAEELRERGVSVVTCRSCADVVAASDVIVFSTIASSPHVHDVALLAHNPLVLNISLRDLAPELLEASDNLVDDVDHFLRANTSPHLTQQKLGHERFLNGTIADALTGKLRLSRERPVIVSPFGLGVLDVAVGKWILDAAVSSRTAVRIDDFFFEVAR
jgi:ornithine cyclodeaminase